LYLISLAEPGLGTPLSSGVARGAEGASAPGAKVGGAKMSKTFKKIFINF